MWERTILSFAEKFRAYMLGSGLSYDQLSKRTGISVGTLHGWGCGTREPNAQNLRRIAYFLGSDPNELLCWDEYLEEQDR